MAHFTEHDIVAHLRDGRIIAMGRNTVTLPHGNSGIVVRLPDLKYIERILQVEFYKDPDVTAHFRDHNPMNKHISGNVVGMTLLGLMMLQYETCDVTIEVIAVGPP